MKILCDHKWIDRHNNCYHRRIIFKYAYRTLRLVTETFNGGGATGWPLYYKLSYFNDKKWITIDKCARQMIKDEEDFQGWLNDLGSLAVRLLSGSGEE